MYLIFTVVNFPNNFLQNVSRLFNFKGSQHFGKQTYCVVEQAYCLLRARVGASCLPGDNTVRLMDCSYFVARPSCDNSLIFTHLIIIIMKLFQFLLL